MGTKGDSQPREGSSAEPPPLASRSGETHAVTALPARQVGACVCCHDQANHLCWMSLPGTVGSGFFSAPKPLLSAPSLPWLGVGSLSQRLQTISWSDIAMCNSTAHLNILNCPKRTHIWTQKIRQKHVFYRFNPLHTRGCMCIKALVWSTILPSRLSSQKPGSKFCFLS